MEPDLDSPRKHFRCALLEYRAASTPEDVILKRETFWKEALLTRGKYAALLHDSTAARVGAFFQLLVQDTTAQDFGLPSSAIRLRM